MSKPTIVRAGKREYYCNLCTEPGKLYAITSQGLPVNIQHVVCESCLDHIVSEFLKLKTSE